ncbi:alpha-L-rhamnosidase C-terminal domain-containing protein [Steroidobacter sp.]|uniref:alpha-L-rhamnosidase C-terminal domain-containing protein n=1 Tax=Steroidobacter sp. TaxID=1978227 RepID=UPI001A53F3D2|nr:hypothetical protein [Steroidobacter sp.]
MSWEPSSNPNRAVSRWRRNPGERNLAQLDVSVPPNTTATVRIPAEDPSLRWTVRGSASARYVGFDAGHHRFELGPGVANFVAAIAGPDTGQ